MKMDDEKKIINKVDKGYELVTKAGSLRLHLKEETLRHEHTFTIFKILVHESYYIGKQHEFMGLIKPKVDKNFTFLTLTTEEAKDSVLNDIIIFNHEKLQVSITRH